LPGGHQEPGEALEQAVVREVYEETAAKVSVLDLVRVYEHIYPSRKEQGVVNHSVEFAFLCRIDGFYQPEMGKHPDPHQVAVEWIDMGSLKGLSFYPARLAEILTTFKFTNQKIYSGDMT
jgi:ADP-ribose pyrophosphatase YjhB (NUDIX family)